MDEASHAFWHRFNRGGCIECGYHCIDCPLGTFSCKCTPKPEHVLSDECRRKWCRLHFCPTFGDHEAYPIDVNILTSQSGWCKITVHHGPAAFYPGKKDWLAWRSTYE